MSVADVAERKKLLIKEYGGQESNTGSLEVQIALLTDRILNLSTHFETNKKDEHSKRGMLKLISRRKSLLKYLRNENVERYRELIAKLGLRK
ncbi:MAG: 30S ribosomal protein S15 [Bdellovibrionota bacterium]